MVGEDCARIYSRNDGFVNARLLPRSGSGVVVVASRDVGGKSDKVPSAKGASNSPWPVDIRGTGSPVAAEVYALMQDVNTRESLAAHM